MSVQIGFAEKINWDAPGPGKEFTARMIEEKVITANPCGLTLSSIIEVNEKFQETTASKESKEAAAAFVNWCRDYWDQRRFGDEDGITVLISA